MRAYEIILEDDYKGQHTAPNKETGAPLFDLTANDIYPDDIYSPQGPRYYSSGYDDTRIFYIINQVHNKPNAKVKIYRAVPHELSTAEKYNLLVGQMADYQRRGRIPKEYKDQFSNGSAWYDWAYDERERLFNLPSEHVEPLIINPGDWVTIDRKYAVEHGNSNLKRQYKIASKTVPAKQVFTAGDSVQEWGWDPT